MSILNHFHSFSDLSRLYREFQRQPRTFADPYIFNRIIGEGYPLRDWANFWQMWQVDYLEFPQNVYDAIQNCLQNQYPNELAQMTITVAANARPHQDAINNVTLDNLELVAALRIEQVKLDILRTAFEYLQFMFQMRRIRVSRTGEYIL